MNVGVRELKQHLSDYLDRVARGEVIQITDRGVPKAQIIPLPGAAAFEQGVEEGWLRPPTRRGALAEVTRTSAAERSAAVLGEDRGE
jgi:prevent-host-death family protein